jgi:hypothetical protein
LTFNGLHGVISQKIVFLKKGLVPNAKLVFLCRKNIADAHDEMEDDFYANN